MGKKGEFRECDYDPIRECRLESSRMREQVGGVRPKAPEGITPGSGRTLLFPS